MNKPYSLATAIAAALLTTVAAAQQKGQAGQHGFTTLHPVHGAVSDQRGGPANDLCTGATAHSLNIGGQVVINGNNTGATDSEGITFNTVWESFTVTTCTNIEINYCGTNPAFGNFALGIGDCPITTVIPIPRMGPTEPRLTTGAAGSVLGPRATWSSAAIATSSTSCSSGSERTAVPSSG